MHVGVPTHVHVDVSPFVYDQPLRCRLAGPACRLYIDSHLSSAAGGTPLHRQPPQLGCRRSGAAPLITDGHLGSAAGGAASSTSTFSSSTAPSWLALHIQHRLDNDAAVETPRRGAARLALHVQARHQPTTMPPRRRRGATPARPALHVQARHRPTTTPPRRHRSACWHDRRFTLKPGIDPTTTPPRRR